MPSLTAYYQALARALDDQAIAGVTAGTTTTFTAQVLVTAATGATSSLYEGRWAFHRVGANAPQQTMIISGVPTTGVMTVSPAINAPANTDVLDLTSLFPVISTIGADTDYRTLCNRALGRMMLEVEVEIAVTTSDAYPMTLYPWLDRPERLRQVREPNPFSASLAPIDSMWRQWEIVSDPATASLRTKVPFSAASGNISLEAIRPAVTWIAVPTTFAESLVGLVGVDDKAQPSVEEFLPFGLDEALNVLIARSPGRPNAEWARMQEKARADIAASRYRDRTQMIEQAPTASPAAGRAA